MNFISKKVKRALTPHYFRTRRCIFLLLVLAAIPQVNFDSTQAGLQILTVVSWSMFGVIVVISILSGFMTLRKESRYIELLILTNIHPSKFIVLHYAAEVFNVSSYLMSTLPIIICCIALGGISGQQILHIYLACMVAILHCHAIGMIAYLLSRVIDISYTAAIFFVYYTSYVILTEQHTSLTSFDVIRQSLSGKSHSFHCWSLLFETTFSFIFLLCAVQICKRHFLKIMLSLQMNLRRTLSYKERKKRIPPVEEDAPVTWKDDHFIHNYPWDNKFHGMHVFLSVPLFVIYLPLQLVLLLIASIRAFSEEEKGLQLLFLTKLSPRDIVRQKIDAVINTISFLLVINLITSMVYHTLFGTFFTLYFVAVCFGMHLILYLGTLMGWIAIKRSAIVFTILFAVLWSSIVFALLFFHVATLFPLFLFQYFLKERILLFLERNICDFSNQTN